MILPALTPNVLVEALLPAVDTITLPNADTYELNDEMYITLNFNTAVNITGTPRFEVDFSEGEASAPTYFEYSSGSGGSSIIFRYVVQAGDVDLDGIEVKSPIDLNGGAIQSLNTSNADLVFTDEITAVAADAANVLVDSEGPLVVSVDEPADGSFGTGSDITFVLNTNRAITVDDGGGTPRIALDIGGSTVYAEYASGTGTTALTFTYTVQSGDLDSDGIGIVETIEPNSGTLQDTLLNDLSTSFSTITDPLTAVLVDGVDPTITNIASTTPGDGTYGNWI